RALRVRDGAVGDREEVGLARRGVGGLAGAPAPRPTRERPRSNGTCGLVEGRGGGASHPAPGRFTRSSGGILCGGGARPRRRGGGGGRPRSPGSCPRTIP